MKANGDGCFYRCSHPEPNRWAYNGRMFLRLISTINGDKYHCDCSAYVVDVKEHKTDFQPLSRSGREAKIAYDVKLDETNGKYFVETTVPSYSDWTGLSADEAEDVPIDFPEAEGTARGQGG
jgi:hypothetical protein